MSVDVFGRSLKTSVRVFKGPPGHGFIQTNSGDYDIQQKKLCNVGEAVAENDAVNLQLLKKYTRKIEQEIVIDKFNLLSERLQELSDQVLEERERFVMFTRKTMWPLFEEVKKIKENDQEFQQNLSKIMLDLLDYMSI